MSDITSTVVPPFEEIGGCRLLHQVGQGGMGVVYAAEHLALKRRVAIKLLPESKADDDHVQRFIEEARTCARIQHPNVIPIHNVGYDRGRYFIEMQYVDGQNLADVVRTQGGPIPWRTALKITRHAAKGLQAVHQAGLIHRDVKPSNIMIAGDRVYLMDFGLVRKETGSDLTRSGVIVGTPAFMSPEQCLGEDIDRRTDVYSLGATLYYLLTGHVPYEDNNIRAMLARVSRREAPPGVSTINPYVPPQVGEAVERAMAFDLGLRYRSIAEFLDDIKHLLSRSSAIDTSTIDTSRVLMQDTRPQKLVPELAPLEAIPTRSSAEQFSQWKLGLIAAGVFVGLLTVGLLLNAIFGGGEESGGVAAGGAETAADERTTAESVPPTPSPPPGVDVSGMVYIPPGMARLGEDRSRLRAHLLEIGASEAQTSATIDNWRERRESVHVEGFWIDAYEVTNAEYAEFVADEGHLPPTHWTGRGPPAGMENHPVTYVSYDDAQAYATWADKKLPTAAQWVRAHRGDAEQFYPWGDTYETDRANVGENLSFPSTSAVTATPRDVSVFGVYNLVGNVAEIVRERDVAAGTGSFKGSDWTMIMFEGLGGGRGQFLLSAISTSSGGAGQRIGFRCVVEVNRTE